ncbi:MAG: quinolinate synthase NadA [Kiritimatiellia bacterium]
MNTVDRAIELLRRECGHRLFIPAHYYQENAVLRHADTTGDSLELSRRTAARHEAEKIVFCGVRFMAETADILKAPAQTVYMPELQAGCPMADMATPSQADTCAARLDSVWKCWKPVVYVNSSAAIKAFCGRRGGSACTSSNAGRVLQWALQEDQKVLFLPDENLAVNTAQDLGLPDGQVRVYDPLLPLGGLSDDDLQKTRLVAWKGYCHVHHAFTTEHVHHVRARHPEARIIVHPEARREVVRLCDFHGSTTQLMEYVRRAPDGSEIVIGTENHFVQRLAEEEAGRVTIHPLYPSTCPDMSRVTPETLLGVLESWPSANTIRVPPEIAAEARLCLDRMLAL